MENFSYGMPGFRLDGKTLAWYAGWKAHLSMYPITGAAKKENAAALKKYNVSKGTVQFPLGEPAPLALVKRIVRSRVKEIRAKE